MDKCNQMSGSEIARQLGITRQTVSATTKRALGKMYKSVKASDMVDNPFDAMVVLMSMCNISDGAIEDVSSFLSLFPEKIQTEVKGSIPTEM